MSDEREQLLDANAVRLDKIIAQNKQLLRQVARLEKVVQKATERRAKAVKRRL